MKRFLAIGLVALLALVCISTAEAVTTIITVRDAVTTEPIPGARVRILRVAGIAFDGYTNDVGVVIFVSGLGIFRYEITKNGYYDALEDFSAGQNLTVYLQPKTPNTSITVKDAEDDTPIAGARVRVFWQDSPIFDGLTGEDGAVEFYLLPFFAFEYFVTKAGYDDTSGFISCGQDLTVYLQPVTVAPNTSITVKDAENYTSVAGARVKVSLFGGQLIFFDGLTGEDGTVEFTLPPHWVCEYLVTKEGYDDTSGDIYRGQDLTVYLQPLAGVTSITVKDAEDGTAIAGARVKIYTIDDNQLLFSGMTDEDGRIVVYLPTGIYAYAITKQGYRSATDTFYLFGQNIDVYLQRKSMIHKTAIPLPR